MCEDHKKPTGAQRATAALLACEENRRQEVKRVVELAIWEALNVVGYPARGKVVQAPKKVCKLVNYIGDKWIDSIMNGGKL